MSTPSFHIDARRLRDAVAALPGDHARFTVTDSELIIFGSDGVVTVEQRLTLATDVDAAEVTLPLELLNKTLKSLDGDVAVAIEPHGIVFATSASRRSVAASGRLPVCPVVDEDAWCVIDPSIAAQLSAAIHYTLPAALQDTSRPTVSGVRIDYSTVVSCDGTRLHWYAGDCPYLNSFLTLPVKGAEALASLIEQCAAQPAKGKRAAIAATQLRYAVGDRVIAWHRRGVDAEQLLLIRREPEPYCDWRRLSNGEAGLTLSITRDVLAAALKGCVSDSVTLSYSGGDKFTLSWVVRDSANVRRIGDGSVEMSVSVSGNTMAASIELKVATAALSQAIAHMDDTITLSLMSGSPLRVVSGSRHAVIMFLR